MSRSSLNDLTVEYFTRRGYQVKKAETDEESVGSPDFDLIVSKKGEVHPVRIKDWNRTLGVNIVISLDKASQAASFSSPILVSEKFSDHAKAYANRRGIILITRLEMMRSLR